MSGEWFQIARRPLASPGRHPLADPLEAEEWRGLNASVSDILKGEP